jgi:hypothetical protein
MIEVGVAVKSTESGPLTGVPISEHDAVVPPLFPMHDHEYMLVVLSNAKFAGLPPKAEH